MYRLIVSDIDGTLYDDEKKVGRRDEEIIKKMLDGGIKIVLSSGRFYRGMLPLAKKLNLFGAYHIATNGTCIFSADGEVVETSTFCETGYSNLIRHLRKTCKSFVVINNECMWYETQDTRCIDALGSNNGDAPYIRVDDVLSVNEPYQICAFYSSLSECDEILEGEIEGISGSVTFREDAQGDAIGLIDYIPAGTDKYAALKKIAAMLGIKRDEIIGFGNNDNDLPIVKGAAVGVCVNNSSENLKNASNLVLDRTNNENPMEELYEKLIKPDFRHE